MSAYAVYGKLYYGSITGATGTSGTAVTEIAGRTMTFVIPRRIVLRRNGRSPDMIKAFYVGTRVPTLVLPLRDLSAASIKLLLDNLSASGGTAESDGSNTTAAMKAANTTAVIIRPTIATERTLYIKAAALAPSSPDLGIVYSPDSPVFEGGELHLAPTRGSGDSEPAWLYAPAATINSTYAGLS